MYFTAFFDEKSFLLLNISIYFFLVVLDFKDNQDNDSQTYLAVIVGILMALSLIMAAAIFFITFRNRTGKSLNGSALPSKAGWPVHGSLFENEYHKQNGGMSLDSAATQLLVTSGGDSLIMKRPNLVYQEPHMDSRPSPYYSYSTLLSQGTIRPDLRYKDTSGMFFKISFMHCV